MNELERAHIGYLNATLRKSQIPHQPANALTNGGTIGLFSPSEPVGGGRLARLTGNLDRLRKVGFRIVESEGMKKISAYTAGSVADRVKDIHALIADPEIDCLLATWGGKQCNELLAWLDFDAIGEAQKPVIAFSDGCVLLNAITSRTGLVTFHGPNVAGKLDESEHWDMSLLDGSRATYGFDVFALSGQRENVEVWRPGIAEGRLFGGNLNTFVLGLVGTSFLEISEPILFFWESLGDRPQIIHQQLTCLVNAGWFDHIVGMVVGDLFVDPEPEGCEWKNRSARDATLNALDSFTFPILKCDTFGHRRLENPIVPIGPRCELDTTKRAVKLLDMIVKE